MMARSTVPVLLFLLFVGLASPPPASAQEEKDRWKSLEISAGLAHHPEGDIDWSPLLRVGLTVLRSGNPGKHALGVDLSYSHKGRPWIKPGSGSGDEELLFLSRQAPPNVAASSASGALSAHGVGMTSGPAVDAVATYSFRIVQSGDDVTENEVRLLVSGGYSQLFESDAKEEEDGTELLSVSGGGAAALKAGIRWDFFPRGWEGAGLRFQGTGVYYPVGDVTLTDLSGIETVLEDRESWGLELTAGVLVLLFR